MPQWKRSDWTLPGGERTAPGPSVRCWRFKHAGDGGVGVVVRQPADQVDSALIGAGHVVAGLGFMGTESSVIAPPFQRMH